MDLPAFEKLVEYAASRRRNRARNCWFLATIACLLLTAPSFGQGLVMLQADSNYDFDDQYDIHLMRGDGTAHRRIRTRYPMLSASLHPKGNTIVYSRADKPELRAINADGNKDRLLTRLVSLTEEVSWSPDGRYIAYEEDTSTPNALFVLGISYFDLRTKKHIRTVPVTVRHIGSVINNGITDIQWSPNRRTLGVQVKELVFDGVGASVFYRGFTVNVPTGKSRGIGDVINFGFLDNKRILAKHDDLSLGYVDITNPSRFVQLVDLGDAFDEATPTNNGRSALVRYRYFFGGEFDINDTNLTRISGESQSQRVEFDLIEINLANRVGKFVTPTNNSFLPNRFRFLGMQWLRRFPKRVFRTDTCWGWVVTIKGTQRADRITGTPGADVIHSLSGNDVVKGGAGNDVICSGRGSDRLLGQGGNDVLFGDMPINSTDTTPDLLNGHDRLYGGDGVDTLFGAAGNDRLFGGPDNDFLSGGAGNDLLDGQEGDINNGNGGEGIDTCRRLTSADGCER